jgi:hypothetical protein
LQIIYDETFAELSPIPSVVCFNPLRKSGKMRERKDQHQPDITERRRGLRGVWNEIPISEITFATTLASDAAGKAGTALPGG